MLYPPLHGELLIYSRLVILSAGLIYVGIVTFKQTMTDLKDFKFLQVCNVERGKKSIIKQEI